MARDGRRGCARRTRYAAAVVSAVSATRRPVSGVASFDMREARVVGAAMLGIAAVRPLVPFEFVPPCPLRLITGVPCPMCGMTRGVTSLVHGDIAHAVFMNPASVLAVVVAILVLLRWRTKRVVVPVWLIVAVLALMWCWQLFKYATGRAL